VAGSHLPGHCRIFVLLPMGAIFCVVVSVLTPLIRSTRCDAQNLSTLPNRVPAVFNRLIGDIRRGDHHDDGRDRIDLISVSARIRCDDPACRPRHDCRYVHDPDRAGFGALARRWSFRHRLYARFHATRWGDISKSHPDRSDLGSSRTMGADW
jgi:hypothetical protein